MEIIKSIIISFSLYSKIPMPIFEWKQENMKHAISFLPWIGAVIGALSFLVLRLGMAFELPVMVSVLILTVVPIMITGGFHVDGFMDVQDAIHSYQSKEKKLEIMKDPHIGAFAVISAGVALLIFTASLYQLVYKALNDKDFSLIYIYFAEFFMVRACCGITSIFFPNAKKDGMLNMETGKSGRGDVIFLSLQAILCAVFMCMMNFMAGITCMIVLFIDCIWYKRKCIKEFGGVSGDTAGFFVVTCEIVVLVTLAVLSVINI